MQSDPALERFDKLRVREVGTEDDHTASTFLAQFQSTAASLGPDEKIKLEVIYLRKSNMELLKAVLADPQASKICSLQWWYDGKEDVNSVIPMLINNCPELASLDVDFEHHYAFDFASSLLEHPGSKLKKLVMLENAKGDSARFFAALGQSQVSAPTLSYFPELAQDLCEYLARDLLVRLDVWMNENQIPSEMILLLAKSTRLVELNLVECNFSPPTAFIHFPKSITTLTLDACMFVDGFDWSFLADSNLRELDFHDVKGVDGVQLGSALAVHLGAKGLNKLRFAYCDFADETLAVAGVELDRIKKLEIDGYLNGAPIELISLALQSPNSEMKELALPYDDDTASSIEDYLVPVSKHPNCNLDKLVLWAYNEHEEAARKVEDTFRKHRALFVLLQGRQLRRRYCPLRRLPVEMFRLVGQVLS
ncbi:hypothetical protein BASA81_006229 [Batrachochytrium salamandrivorans]|nr:hypothetical protein BASA81_006229 [Batrachochytrium salamandrivorans]